MHVFNCEAKIAAYAAEKLVAIDEVISAIPGFCKALCPVLFGDNQSVFKTVADALIPRICGQLSVLGKRVRFHDDA